MKFKLEKPLIGMRTLKTGLAVMMTLVISNIGMIVNPIYAAIGTVLAMQQTVKGSFLIGKNRLLGTLIGGVIAYLIALIYTGNTGGIILTSLGVIVTICVCNSLKLNDSISIALTVLLSILIGINENDPLTYSAIRIWDTSIGVLIGIIINYFIAQPDYQKVMNEKIQSFYLILEELVSEKDCELTLDELQRIKQGMKELDDAYRQFIADLPFGGGDAEAGKHKLDEVLEACHDVYFHSKSLVFLNSSELDKTLTCQFKAYHEERLRDIEIYLHYVILE